MITPIELLPGVTLRCFTDDRFKQGLLSLQLVRPMNNEEAGLNALLPAVLLQGCENYPDLRQITLHLDDLYGAGMGVVVRRTGDYQTTGISCSFMEDQFALPGEQVFGPMMEFLYQMLRRPCTQNGVFPEEFVESEKRNLLAAIDAQKNDKRSYAADQLRQIMCREDSFGVPRLGNRDQVAAITAQSLWAHYEKLLEQSQVQLFYVGSQQPEQVARSVKPLFEGICRKVTDLPPQTPLKIAPETDREEVMEVSQGKLCMGFTTPITNRHELYEAMQVLMLLYGGSTGKLFNVIREKLSLCYDIGGVYYGTKGMMTVCAGIDFDKKQQVQQEVLELLDACRCGNITGPELDNAKKTLITQLQASHDSPGAIEGYYTTAVLTGVERSPAEYIRAVEQVTIQQVQQAAHSFQLNTVYFLRGRS